MKISLITPADRYARAGNRTTAVRWARLFRDLGHKVKISVAYADERTDMMVALHAWRSAGSIERFRIHRLGRPLIVALTGMDIYRYMHTHRQVTENAMELADALVCRHDLVANDIPARLAGKLHVIHQSAKPLPCPRKSSKLTFDVCVAGQLRDEKDPLRTALAVRDLPAASRLRVIHLGPAIDAAWASRARAEMGRNPRYTWKGDVPHWVVRRELVKTHLMVLSSVVDGGANVISEAVAAGVPVIASDIPGAVGLLGPNYPGYYPVGATSLLREMLLYAEEDPKFLATLTRQCLGRAPLFQPDYERERWRAVLDQVV